MAGPSGLQRLTLGEQVSARVRSFIVDGVFPPGSRIVESKISELLDVSRGTVREALKEMLAEGLVIKEQKGAVRVRSVRGDAKEIFEVRGALEVLAARKICASPRRSELLEILQGRLEIMRSSADMSFDEQIRADMDFHERLCALSGNPILVEQWCRFRGPIQGALIAVGAEAVHSMMSYERHRLWVDVMREGDEDAIRHAIEEHMQETASQLISAWSEEERVG